MITTHLTPTTAMAASTRSAQAACVPRIRLSRSAAARAAHDDDFEGLRNWTVILTLSAIVVFMATCPVLVLT